MYDSQTISTVWFYVHVLLYLVKSKSYWQTIGGVWFSIHVLCSE
jgi:hypothetical protein